MRYFDAFLKTVCTYVVAVAAIAITLTVQMLYDSGQWDSFVPAFLTMYLLAAVFALPVFAFVGIPYLALGFASWGRENLKAFVAIGAILGTLGALAFGMVMVMPEAVPSFFPIVGFAAGAVSSLVWAQLSHRQIESKID